MAQKDSYIGKVKLLEKLKTNDSISHTTYETGSFILFLEGKMVCLKKDNGLVLKSYKGQKLDVKIFNKSFYSKAVLLDVLSESSSNCLFAVNLDSETDVISEIEKETEGKFVEIRQSLFFLNPRESHYVIQARGLLNFCQSYKFCCFCGGSLKVMKAGHMKQCMKCNVSHYPTLYPVGVTLVENENHDEVLLVKQERHAKGIFSCVAGFIEPGETLEEGVQREIAEEVGLNIAKLEYCSSQYWAMSSSQLTLGCIATTCEQQVSLDSKEIKDAKWVKANELKQAVIRTRELADPNNMDDEKLWTPPKNTVSHKLMVVWLEKYHNFKA